MHSIQQYQDFVLDFLNAQPKLREPKNLYEPIQYILGLGGKKIRPVLTLMSAEIFDADYSKALPAALAVEVFHNFSLVHDDIMDDAPLRRGNVTVHEKWDINTGILSGDAMLILAYQYFEKRFNVNVLGAFTVNTDVMPGAEQLAEIREIIEHDKVACVFSEPQFNPDIINAVAKDMKIKTGVLDPLGATLDSGKDLYFKLIRNMSASFKDC